jgi:gamma-glutamylputrescine oxidase
VTLPAGTAGSEATGASFWQAAWKAAHPQQSSAAALPRRCQVLVVGGGVTGASLLHHLADSDLDVHLVERGRLACGASGRNAGFVLAGVADNYALAVRRLGRPLAREVWAFSVENGDMLAEALAGRAGHRRRGSWMLAASDLEADELDESVTLLREDGFDVTFHRGTADSPARLLTPGDAEVDPVATVHALAANQGSRITEELAVTGIEATSTGVRVHTSAGECTADVVILATNAYTGALIPDIDIVPARGQMLATDEMPERVAERPVYADHGYRYWRQLDDGRVLLGGWRDRAVDEESTDRADISETVQRHLDVELLRLGARAPVTHRWAGIMAFTSDHLPLVGAVTGHPGVFVCAGYSGHGMGFALHATRLLCDHVIAGRPIPEWMSSQRAPVRMPAG